MYKCLTNQSIQDKNGYRLVPIRTEDIENIRIWRNAQIDILRQNRQISVEEQKTYFEREIWPSFTQQRPKQVLFSFMFDQECIGYGGLTHLDWEYRRAELSFLLNTERIGHLANYENDFMHFLSLLSQVAFNDLKLHRLFSETYAFRTLIIQILEKFGFRYEGTLREHVYKNGKWQNSMMHGLLVQEVSCG